MPRASARAAAAALLLLLAAVVVAVAVAARPATAAAAAAAPKEQAWPKPWFCHELDCPEFEVLENLTSIGVELRRYAPSTWVETTVENATSTAPVPAAAAAPSVPPFGGATSRPAAASAGPPGSFPAAASADANAGTGYERAVAIGFYKLFRYISGENLTGQKIPMTAPVRVTVTPGVGPTCGDTFKIAFFLALKAPPPPSDSTVSIVQTPESTFYVNGFGGWATGATYVDRARSVAAALEGAGRRTDDAYFATAGYDSPFRLRGRHNEVWLPAIAEKGAAVAKKAAVGASAKPSAALKLPTASH
jgi:hypothetical protein